MLRLGPFVKFMAAINSKYSNQAADQTRLSTQDPTGASLTAPSAVPKLLTPEVTRKELSRRNSHATRHSTSPDQTEPEQHSPRVQVMQILNNQASLQEFTKTLKGQSILHNLEFLVAVKAYVAMAEFVYQTDSVKDLLSPTMSGSDRREKRISGLAFDLTGRQQRNASAQASNLGPIITQSTTSCQVSFEIIKQRLEAASEGKPLEPDEMIPASLISLASQTRLEDLQEKLMAIRSEINRIFNLHIVYGSFKEVSIPDKMRDKVFVEFDLKNYNPLIFSDAVEWSLDLLSGQPLQTYLASKEKQIGQRIGRMFDKAQSMFVPARGGTEGNTSGLIQQVNSPPPPQPHSSRHFAQ
eukprot:jgi/Hompol1/3913/HPOL_006818-RA